MPEIPAGWRRLTQIERLQEALEFAQERCEEWRRLWGHWLAMKPTVVVAMQRSDIRKLKRLLDAYEQGLAEIERLRGAVGACRFTDHCQGCQEARGVWAKPEGHAHAESPESPGP